MADLSKIILPNGSEYNLKDDAARTSLSGKAPIASPDFTGTPTAPTAASGTNSTQIATTAFVQSAVSGASGGAGLESITWSALKAKRDGGTLTPGGQYRITDYVCTTTQDESRAVSHPYDIVVFADSDSVLNENARAIAKDNDTYYQYADLSAWELKYCIDNDTNRFAWADSTNGKGVVYWLKDDHNNECPYDFKQIQFKRYEITECSVSSLVGKYTALEHGGAITAIDQSNPVWCYTFSYDPEETGTYSDSSVMLFDADNEADVINNKIGEYHEVQDPDEWAGSLVIYLNNNVLFGNYCYSNTFGDRCSSNTFGDYCYSNTFGDYCNSNTFGDGCNSNTFGDSCYFNTFGDSCYFNTFGNECYSNTFGDYCYSNTFGDYCYFNTFGDRCYSNTFGDECTYSTFGYGCSSNTFGDKCSSNTFGDYCYSNTFGYYYYSNTFGDYCNSNTFGDGCCYIDLSAGTSSSPKQYYHVLSGTKGTSNSHVTITGTGGNNYVTYVGKNSSGTLQTWVPADSGDDVYGTAISKTTASTAAKVASCYAYAANTGSYVYVAIENSNSAQSALTLNINSKGAKPIYINGTASSSSNYTLPAGTYLVFYDGTNYYFRTDGLLTGATAATASNNTTLATTAFVKAAIEAKFASISAWNGGNY